MSFTAETEGAKEAVSYLNEVAACVEGKLILGGHSKGGNFAMYAAAFCEEAVKERIVKVYNNDGPGFREEIVRTAAYRELLPKVTNVLLSSFPKNRLHCSKTFCRRNKAL